MHTTGIRSLSFWSVCDQAIVSLGSFLTNIILARSLPATDYGIYTILWVTSLFLNRVHSSLVTQPLSIEAGRCSGERDACLSSGLAPADSRLSLAVPGRPSAYLTLTGTAGARLGLRRCAHPFAGPGNSSRGLMAKLRHRATLWGDIISYLGQAGLIWYLFLDTHATLQAAFAAMAVTSAIAILVQTCSIRCRILESRWCAQSCTPVLETRALGSVFPLSQSIHGPSISLDVSDISWHLRNQQHIKRPLICLE